MSTRALPNSSSSKSHCRNLLTKQPHPLKSLDQIAALTQFDRGRGICAQGTPANHWYCVISGAARCCVVRLDGRRQIVDLLLPGDLFGFSVLDEYDSTIEAIVAGTVVASYPRRQVEALADSDAQLAREIRQMSFIAMSRLQTQLLILGRITALEKVASFILDMAERLSAGEGNSVALPMSRYDIADYLAVSVETVSRSLTDLKHRGVIKLAGARTVRIVDRNALEDGEPRDQVGRIDLVAA
jgi:CRP/FNR family transcriptional regulator, nitrogen fixation regulation protein